MGRKVKVGLEYFPLDVDLFSDLKVRKLIKYQSSQALAVYVHLLCIIYKEGYYIKWEDELLFIISETTGYKEAYIQEVINCCFKIDLLSNEMFSKHKVITSRGIQERYQVICKLLKRKQAIISYSLISSEEMPIISEEMPILSEKTDINSGESAQSKGKEIKEKEIELKGNESSEVLDVKRQKFLIPEMQRIFKEVRPNHRIDTELDFQPLLKISNFIAKQLEIINFKGNPDLEARIVKEWKRIAKAAMEDEFLADKPLGVIYKMIQKIYDKVEVGIKEEKELIDHKNLIARQNEKAQRILDGN